ncbi:MAG: phosphatidate cytidylyltransferase [Comamonadaceae bacterium]|nr:MAG: phosphatidate cytidylyltransferase [Comamonadaceae bacterium]
MLKQRVITAVILLAILLPALFYSPVAFAAIALVLIGAGAWEWGRFSGYDDKASVAVGLACVAMCAGAWYAGWLTKPLGPLWTAAGALWVLGGTWLLRGGVPVWGRIPQIVRVVVGLLALWTAWLAVAQARMAGINFLLSVLVLVWAADIFAYFAGRAFGKRKLAPAISPNKSWEGVWGGMTGVVVLALAWVWADQHFAQSIDSPSLYSHMWAHGWWLLPVAALFMAAMSVVGDLVESLIKRSVGLKDSSGLLPGHGGVLDRVDALLPTLPLALMLSSF